MRFAYSLALLSLSLVLIPRATDGGQASPKSISPAIATRPAIDLLLARPPLKFADGFERGDLSAWSATRR